MRWHLLLTPPGPGDWNMALDHALMERAARAGDCALRVYGWSAPTISFGRNQRALGGYDPDQIARRGLSVVRRPTGGRALLHHREITYSVTAPEGALGALGESYDRINRLLLAALHSLGIRGATIAASQRTGPPGFLPCFAEPAAGELVLTGRKLVGSAQCRCDGALLQHGSILIEDDQQILTSLLRSASPESLSTGSDMSPLPPAATLTSAMGRAPSLDEVAHALFAAARLLEDGTARTGAVDDPLAARAERLRQYYADAAWTWRR